MTCPHAQTTTLRWLYGEVGDAEHAEHVAGCPDCQAVADAHLSVLAVLPDRPAPAQPRPRRVPTWAWTVPLLAAAATLLVMVRPGVSPGPAPSIDDRLLARADVDTLFLDDGLDARLDALDAQLLDLQVELTTPTEVP